MRIVVVAEHFWPEIGGAETMLLRLAENWATTGHCVRVVTRRWLAESPDFERLGSVEIERLPVLKLRMLGTLQFVWQLRRRLAGRDCQADVVYVSMLKHAAWACVGAGTRIGAPIVLRAEGAGQTGDAVWQQTARFGRRIRTKCQQADAIVAPSNAVYKELLAAGYEPNRLHFLPNGAPVPEAPWQAVDTSTNRQRLQLPDRVTIGFVGRLHPLKGVEDLLRAVGLLRQTGRDVQALIVGDGPDAARLKSLAGGLGLQDAAIWTGAVADAQPYLRAADLFVLPSYHEGLSVSLLEAAALGMPVLASDISANRDILPESHLPLVPTRNPQALAAAIARSLDREKKSLTAQRDVVRRQYGIDAVAGRHIELFASLGPAARP